MGKVVTVLGLGPSLNLYVPDGNISIGVNDIWSRIQTDYVVCLDKKDRFTLERLNIIEECRPIKFYSQIDDYFDRFDFCRIELQPYYPNHECQIDIQQLPMSHCSPFVAAVIAYKYHDAEEIHVYGVDLVSHPNLDSNVCGRIQRHFVNLQTALMGKGRKMVIHGDAILKDI